MFGEIRRRIEGEGGSERGKRRDKRGDEGNEGKGGEMERGPSISKYNEVVGGGMGRGEKSLLKNKKYGARIDRGSSLDKECGGGIGEVELQENSNGRRLEGNVMEGGVINVASPIGLSPDTNFIFRDGGRLTFYPSSNDNVYWCYANSLRVLSGNFTLTVIGNSFVVLNDIEIGNDALAYFGDVSGGGFMGTLFVRKTSPHLADALNKIIYNGSAMSRVGVRDTQWSRDYWQIGVGEEFHRLPTPEPATYGAVFCLGAFGLVIWRRRGGRARRAAALEKRH